MHHREIQSPGAPAPGVCGAAGTACPAGRDAARRGEPAVEAETSGASAQGGGARLRHRLPSDQ